MRGGALLPKEGQERLRAVNGELAGLSVKFGDNLLKETNAYRLVVEKREDLAGLPERVVAGAAEAAKKAGLEGKWLFTLQAPSLWPFLQGAENRELRRQIFTAYTTRGDHGDATDNKATLARIAALRAERAQLLGYKTHADFVLDENMAKTPAPRLRVPRPAVDAGEGGGGAGSRGPAGGHPGGREGTSPSSPGTGRTTRRRCARRASTSTSRRCGPTSRSTACARAPSGWRAASTASPSSSARTCPSTTPR